MEISVDVRTNGGGGFMLIYLICLLILGLPVMTMEFSVGPWGPDKSALHVSKA